MKSLNDNPLKSKYPEIFTDEILKHLESEGFKWGNNDSYCYNEIPEVEGHTTYPDQCFKKYIESDSYSITVYIFETSIGVDYDYTCGGNSFVWFQLFNGCSFEEAYDLMVDNVNNNK